jgi:hypothetical protein
LGGTIWISIIIKETMSNKYQQKKGHQDNYVPPYDPGLLAESVDNAGFSEEVLAKLRNGKIALLHDLVVRTEKDMYKINTFNKKNLFEVKRVLQSKNMDFRPEPLPVSSEETQPKPIPNENDKRNPNNRQNEHKNLPDGQNSGVRPNQGERRYQADNRTQTQNDRQNAGVRPNDKAYADRSNQGVFSNERQNASDRQNPNIRENRDNRSRDTRQDAQNARRNIKNDPVNSQSKDRRGNVLPSKHSLMEDASGANPKQSNKRFLDSDGVSEQRTKEEKEKKRPPKPLVTVPKDIYIKINKNDKWGFADRNGKEVVPPIYDEVYSYKEDLCCVEKDGLFGYIDREGKEVIPPMYECAMSFSEGLACVFRNNRCGYINKNNEVIIDFRFEAGTPMIDGNCRVKKDGKWGELFRDNPDEIRWIV